MKTIQMTLDAELVEEVDAIVKVLKTTRSAFTRSALRMAIREFETLRQEERHCWGYETHPVRVGEFPPWEDKQAWGNR